MAEVSIVMPAFNAEATIEQSIRSALDQTFADIEVIVIDDGSRDRTAEVAASLPDPRVRVYSTTNRGVSAARNHGIEQATGSLIAFLDADDLWLPDKLSAQQAALAKLPAAGVCVSSATRVDSELRPLGPMPVWHCRDYTSALLLHSMIAGCISSGLVTRSVVELVGPFDPRFSQSADWDYWLRLGAVTEFAVVDEPQVLYRSSPGNMSSDPALLEADTFAVLDKFFSSSAAQQYAGIRPRVYSNHWLICSGSYLHAGKLGPALRCLGRGLAADPGNLSRPAGAPARWLRRLAGRESLV